MKDCKTSFLKYRNYGNKIKSVENGEIIDDDAKVAEELSNFS